MNGQPAGQCQVCGDGVTGYSREHTGRPLTRAMTKRLPPPKPLTAEPCGHEQPEPVIFPGNSPTYRHP